MNLTATPNKDVQDQSGQKDRFRSQLGPLILLTALFFVNFISRIVSAPLTPTIETELGLDHADTGSLFLVISMGYFISLIGSGFVSSRYTHKATILISTFTVSVALFGVTLCSGLWDLRMTLLLLGLGAGLYLPSGISTLTALVDRRNWGKAIAIHEIAPNLSFVIAPLVAELILQYFRWQAIYMFLAVLAILLGLVFFKFGDGAWFSGKRPDFEALGLLFKVPSYWLMVAVFGLAISSSIGIFAMLPLYLVVGQGIEQDFANTLISISRISCLVVVFGGGWFSDRFGPIKALKALFILTGGLTVLIGVAPTPWLYAVVFLQPMLSACIFPAGFAALSMVCPPQVRHLAVSFTAPIAFLIGGGVTPTLIGAIGDWGSLSAGIVAVGVFALSGTIIASFLRAYPEDGLGSGMF